MSTNLIREHRATLPSGRERTFGIEEVIVSKTDLKGRITYANEVFCRVADFHPEELIGAPHSIVRHPDMPRCVFKLLWDTISAGNEIFAYVKNMARNGDHYWVLAHVTPTFDKAGQIVGFHSNRRCPERTAIQTIEGIYRDLLAIEKSHSNGPSGLAASSKAVLDLLESKGITYDQLIFSITPI